MNSNLNEVLDTVGLWLITYLLHSTLLLGAAWLLQTRLPRAGESLWRTALVAGLLTASLQVGIGVRPLTGTFDLALERPAPNNSARTRERSGGSIPFTKSPGLARAGSTPIRVQPTHSRATVQASDATTAPVAAAQATPRLGWRQALALVWGAFALLGALLLLLRQARFRSSLNDRRRLEDPRLIARTTELAHQLGLQRPIRLSVSSRLPVPFAHGWFRREICLPTRLVEELALDEQEAVLAHEIAHHERRDPLWHAIAQWMTTLFFFQPLNHRARLELGQRAELSCDGLAADLTGHPLALARSLTQIARWSLGIGLPAGAALTSPAGTDLRTRVHRLAGGKATSLPGSRWGAVLGIVLAGAVVSLAPALAAPKASTNLPGATPIWLPIFASSEASKASPQSQTPPASTSPPAPAAPVNGEPAPLELRKVPTLTSPRQPSPAPAPKASPTGAEPAPAPKPAQPSEPTKGPQEAPPTEVAESADGDARTDEEREALEEELERVFEELEEILETEIESSLEAVEEAVEWDMEELEELIESQMEVIEEELEATMERLGEAVERRARQLEIQPNGPDYERLQAEIEEFSAALGELGGIIGSTLGSADGSLGTDLSNLTVPFSRMANEMAQQYSALAIKLSHRLERAQINHERLSPEEIEEIRSRARSMAEAMRPKTEELEAMRHQIQAQIGPMRERMEQLSKELTREVEAWKVEHRDLLERLNTAP